MRAALCALFILVFPLTALHAAELSIQADTLEHQGRLYNLGGNVRIEKQGLTIEAARAVFDERSYRAELQGNVVFEDTDARFSAREAVFNVREETGTLLDVDAMLKKDNLRISSRKIEKRGPSVYELGDAYFTSCESPPDWSIHGKSAKVTMGNIAQIKHASFRVRNFPVFYSPYLWVPVAVDRQTGLLAPSVGYGNFGGVHLRQPFFWAFAEDKDATFTLDYYSRRAYGGSAEARYVGAGGISGTHRIGLVRDWKADRNYLTLTGSHTGPLLGGARAFLEMDVSSYGDFYRLYSRSFDERARRFLESKGEANLVFPGTGKLYLEARWFQDLKSDVEQGTIPQRLPKLGFYLYPRDVGGGLPAVFALQSAIAHSFREHGRRQARFELAPRAAYVIGDGINFFQAAGLAFRSYRISGPEEEINRVVLDYEAALRARLSRHYGEGEGEVTHYLEPKIAFLYRGLSGGDPPFAADSIDTEDETRAFEAVLLNRFKDARGEFLTIKLSERYDTGAARGERPFKPIHLALAASRPFYMLATASYEPYRSNIETAEFTGRFQLSRQALLHVKERFSREEDTWFHNLGTEVQLTPKLLLGGNIWYDTKGSGLRDLEATLYYKSPCWGVKFIFSQQPGNTAFYIRLELLGLGQSRG